MMNNLQKKCQQCGTTNYGVIHYCLKCGSPLADKAEDPVPLEKIDDYRFEAPTIKEPLPEPMAFLEVISGPDSGAKYELFDGLQFGRSKSSDIVIDSPKASRSHALIEQNEYQQWLLRDLGSTNGTVHNQKRITRPSTLYNGDEIQIGDFHFRVTIKKPYMLPITPDFDSGPVLDDNDKPLAPLPERKGCLSNKSLIIIAVFLVIACVCTGLYFGWNFLADQGILDIFY